MARAEAVIKAKDEQRAQTESRLVAVDHALQPLTAVGWGYDRLGCYQLPLTEPTERWPGEILAPMLLIWLSVGRNWTTATVMTRMYNDVDVAAYVSRPYYRRSFEGISGPMPPPNASPGAVPIWRVDCGWMDTQTDWAQLAEEICDYTADWVDALAALADECRRVLAARAAASES